MDQVADNGWWLIIALLLYRHSSMRMHYTQLWPSPRTNSMDYHTVQVIPQNLKSPQSYVYHGIYTQPWPPSHVHHCNTVLCVYTHTHTHTHTYLPIGCRTTQLKRKATGEKGPSTDPEPVTYSLLRFYTLSMVAAATVQQSLISFHLQLPIPCGTMTDFQDSWSLNQYECWNRLCRTNSLLVGGSSEITECSWS